MKADELIPATWFCAEENEKSKMNWLLYEYALKLHDHIESSRDKQITGWRATLGDERLAEFCAYFSKRLRKSLRDRNAGVTRTIEFSDRFVRDYCHGNSHAVNDIILEAALEAWESLLECCAVCPNRCLAEPDCHCDIFDRMERGGYFSY